MLSSIQYVAEGDNTTSSFLREIERERGERERE
jgi:hypothetical protein